MAASIRTRITAMFSVTILLFALAGSFLVWRLWTSSGEMYERLPRTVGRFDRAEVLRDIADNIQHYGEVLTQAARNYALTGDASWKKRYEENEPILTKNIGAALDKGDDFDRDAFREISDANVALVEMEKISIKLVDEARLDRARDILNGAVYLRYKDLYKIGFEKYMAKRESEHESAMESTTSDFEDILRRRKDAARFFAIALSAIVVLAGLIFAYEYFFISRYLIRPLATLQGSVKKIAAGDLNERAYISTGDEIGDLADDFNGMVAALRSLLEKNEKNIADLEAANDDLRTRDEELVRVNKELTDLRINLETKVDDRTRNLSQTQKAILNIMGDLQAAKEETDRANAGMKEAYDELKSTQARLVQAEKMATLGRFSSGIAHEVKNPLAIILGGMEYLQKKLKTADLDTKTALEKIKEAVFRADRVIQNLLRFARPARMETDREDLRNIVNDSVAFFKYKAPLINIVIDVALAESPVFAMVDKNQIQQVLFNLISNAVDSMPGGGSITIRAYEKDIDSPAGPSPYGVMEVVDTGEGISDSNKKRLWEPFFTTKRDKGGTGLGLPVSKSIVESHNGSLEIESMEGKGTSAKVVLPLAR